MNPERVFDLGWKMGQRAWKRGLRLETLWEEAGKWARYSARLWQIKNGASEREFAIRCREIGAPFITAVCCAAQEGAPGDEAVRELVLDLEDRL